MGATAGASFVTGAAVGFAVAGPVGALVCGTVMGMAGRAVENREHGKQVEREKALRGLTSQSSTGEVVKALEKANKESISFTSEGEVEIGGRRIRDTRSRTVRRG